MRKILNFLKFFILFSVFSSFIFGFLTLYILWKYSPEMPSYSELKNYNPSLTTRVFTSDGLLLDKYFIEERLFVPIDRIPNTLIEAFISAEDKKFYSHFGIDPIAILRASITNFINLFADKRIIGASTITQQVVKNLLLLVLYILLDFFFLLIMNNYKICNVIVIYFPNVIFLSLSQSTNHLK